MAQHCATLFPAKAVLNEKAVGDQRSERGAAIASNKFCTVSLTLLPCKRAWIATEASNFYGGWPSFAVAKADVLLRA
jgi:hypothetical protein